MSIVSIKTVSVVMPSNMTTIDYHLGQLDDLTNNAVRELMSQASNDQGVSSLQIQEIGQVVPISLPTGNVVLVREIKYTTDS